VLDIGHDLTPSLIAEPLTLRVAQGLGTQESQHGEHAPVVLRGVGQSELVEDSADVRRARSFRGRAGEQRDRRSEGVQEVLPADGPEFSGAEESGHRDLAQRLRDQPGVVVGPGEQPRTPAVAGEQQGTGRLAAAEYGGFPRQGALEILIR
jgi:hypothetical protein